MTFPVALLVIFLCVLLQSSSVVAAAKKTKKSYYDTNKYVKLCPGKPAITSKRGHAALQWLLQTSGHFSLAMEGSHQHKAACWILYEKKMASPSSKTFGQRYALAVLYFATTGAKWKLADSWLTSKSECTWYGISCDSWGNVKSIDLGFNDLNGLLPRELAVLQKVVEVDVHGNDLQGVLPHVVLAAWTHVEILRLHMNGFFGSIHSEIGLMRSLKELHLFGNYFAGKLPTELANLRSLEILDVYANALTGTIPSELAKVPTLKEMDLHDNFFVGTMPAEICQKKLRFLATDCYGRKPEVKCDCCTHCCEGLPYMRCIDMKTKQEVIIGADKDTILPSRTKVGTTKKK